MRVPPSAPAFPAVSGGTPAHQRLSTPGPFSWLPALPHVPSPTLVLSLCATRSVFLQPWAGSCLHCPPGACRPLPSPPSRLSLFSRSLPLLSLCRPVPRVSPLLPRQCPVGRGAEGFNQGARPALLQAWFCHGMATLGHPCLPSEGSTGPKLGGPWGSRGGGGTGRADVGAGRTTWASLPVRVSSPEAAGLSPEGAHPELGDGPGADGSPEASQQGPPETASSS